MMNQALALEIMLAGESVLLTGPAGAGKTFVLNQFIRIAKSEGKHVSVTATTGLAATHLGGTTIHAWAGIGVMDSLPHDFAQHVSKGRRDIITKTDVLIIDEISMLHDYRLDMVDMACRLVREKPDIPFGGLQIIMSGDFFQLPPINREGSRAGQFVVFSNVWQVLNPTICYLEEQHRQDDEDLLTILNAMRAGDVRRRHAEMLLERGDAEPPEDSDITELHTTNIDVDKINQAKLDALEGDEYAYSQWTTGGVNYIEGLQRSVLAPAELKLKDGAFVMAVKNAPDRKYANGSIGVVTGFDVLTDYPIVKFHNGRTINMMPDTWELRDGDKKRASITQIPLRLAWAITVHKSQGMTLDAARIDLSRAFVEGMGYVALSRVKNLRNLYLAGLNKMALRVSDDARYMNDHLRESSSEATKKFTHLVAKTHQRSEQKPEPRKKEGSSKWGEKLEKMRETYPNAYRPWSREDDEALKLDFQNGVKMKKLSKKFGRHENSILLRLQKHFGEEIVVG